MEDSGDEPETPLSGTLSRGQRTRRRLLLANSLIWLGCLVAASAGMSPRNPWQGQTIQLVAQIIPSIAMLGPIGIASILAAWGKGHYAVRWSLFIAVLLLIAGVQSLLEYGFRSYTFGTASGVITYLHQMSEWLYFLVPVAMGMSMLGSFRRLRLGPPELPAVRVTISSIMLATLFLGAMISGKIAIEHAYWNALTQAVPGMHEEDSAIRSRVIMQIAIACPVMCLFLTCVVASAYRWYARVLVIVLIIGVYLLYRQITSGVPAGIQPSFQIAAICGAITLAVAAFWIAWCVRRLDQSGWPCCSRPAVAAGQGST